MININSLYNSNFIQLFLTMYMTPYKNFYYYIIGCLNHFFFSQEKETLHQRKSACSLRSPNGSKGRSPQLISPWSHASWWKKPCLFPVDFVNYRENRYFEFLFIFSIKNCCFGKLREGGCAAAWGAQLRNCIYNKIRLPNYMKIL